MLRHVVVVWPFAPFSFLVLADEPSRSVVVLVPVVFLVWLKLLLALRLLLALVSVAGTVCELRPPSLLTKMLGQAGRTSLFVEWLVPRLLLVLRLWRVPTGLREALASFSQLVASRAVVPVVFAWFFLPLLPHIKLVPLLVLLLPLWVVTAVLFDWAWAPATPALPFLGL